EVIGGGAVPGKARPVDRPALLVEVLAQPAHLERRARHAVKGQAAGPGAGVEEGLSAGKNGDDVGVGVSAHMQQCIMMCFKDEAVAAATLDVRTPRPRLRFGG